MADLKDQTICIKFCFNLEKTASETYARTQTFELYSSFRSDQNLIGILNVHVAQGHVGLNKIWNSSHPSECGCSSKPNCESTVLHRGPKETGGGFWEKMPQQVGHSDWLLHHDNLMLKGSRLTWYVPVAQMYICLSNIIKPMYSAVSFVQGSIVFQLMDSSQSRLYVRYLIQLQCIYISVCTRVFQALLYYLCNKEETIM